jgi:uridine kinase
LRAGEDGAVMQKTPSVVLGISGGTGSGKTTVAEGVLRALGPANAVILHQDSYYLDLGSLPVAEKGRLNFDHPDALDWVLLREHVRRLSAGEDIDKPVYDFRTHSRLAETARVQARALLILEGILIFNDAELRDAMDIKVFLDIDPDVRLLRRLDRDIRERGRSLESVTRQYLDTVRPMHLAFVEPAKRYADIIIPEGGHNRVALDMLIARLRAQL